MVDKKIIIHPGCIQYELRKKGNSPQRILELTEAEKLIKETMAKAQKLVVTDDIPVKPGLLTFGRKILDGDVYLVREDNPVLLRDCVQEGDEVEVFGAYRRICLDIAKDEIESTGAKVKFSPRGTID